MIFSLKVKLTYRLAEISHHLGFYNFLIGYICYYRFMKNLKEKNIKNAIWHIKRHCEIIQNSPDEKIRNHELFHLQASVNCLKCVINNEKPYLGLDRDEVY